MNDLKVSKDSPSTSMELESFSYDSGKATMAVLAAGGIMGIIATILLLLF